jgi:hypothetical protein
MFNDQITYVTRGLLAVLVSEDAHNESLNQRECSRQRSAKS